MSCTCHFPRYAHIAGTSSQLSLDKVVKSNTGCKAKQAKMSSAACRRPTCSKMSSSQLPTSSAHGGIYKTHENSAGKPLQESGPPGR